MNWRSHLRLISALLICLLLNACNDDSSDSIQASVLRNLASQTCTTFDKNEFVYSHMQDIYLWYDTVPSIDPRQYNSPEEVLLATRYEPIDRFSYVTSVEQHNSFVTGEYFGIGIRYNQENGYILSVYEDSPAGENGMQRGDRILFVNDISIDDIIAGSLWDNIFGPAEAGIEVNLTMEKVGSGDIVTLNLVKDTVANNSVLHRSIIDQNGLRIGYLVFDSFNQPAYEELADTFEYFNSENIDELILDVRYNGGGFIDVGIMLASLIAGPAVDGQLFTQFTHNDKYSSENVNLNFRSEPNALSLENLTVLVTGGSCSASEMIINNLSPYINVRTVGQTTCGKPYGSTPTQYCDFVIAAIEFKVTNAEGFGDFFDGLAPNCTATDDGQHDFGDPEEALLNEALYLIENGTCSAAGKSKAKPSKLKKPSTQPWILSLMKNVQ